MEDDGQCRCWTGRPEPDVDRAGRRAGAVAPQDGRGGGGEWFGHSPQRRGGDGQDPAGRGGGARSGGTRHAVSARHRRRPAGRAGLRHLRRGTGSLSGARIRRRAERTAPGGGRAGAAPVGQRLSDRTAARGGAGNGPGAAPGALFGPPRSPASRPDPAPADRPLPGGSALGRFRLAADARLPGQPQCRSGYADPVHLPAGGGGGEG